MIGRPQRWAVRGATLSNQERSLLMGILNVTPDSFSDGGRYLDSSVAVKHGLAMVEAGADLIDVGGESTRPGSDPVSVDEEMARILPVVEGLASHEVVISIDTAKAAVAERAVRAGAAAVNDVTALGDPEMASVVAESGAGLVLMHMKGTPRTMQEQPRYDDVVGEVRQFLVARAERAEAAGIRRERICIDPGIGFGKTPAHNLTLLAHLPVLVEAGYPVLVGTSRKSFIGRLLGGVPPHQRVDGTAAAVALAVGAGAFGVRVHDVARMVDVVKVADAIVRSNGEVGMGWRD